MTKATAQIWRSRPHRTKEFHHEYSSNIVCLNFIVPCFSLLCAENWMSNPTVQCEGEKNAKIKWAPNKFQIKSQNLFCAEISISFVYVSFHKHSEAIGENPTIWILFCEKYFLRFCLSLWSKPQKIKNTEVFHSRKLFISRFHTNCLYNWGTILRADNKAN